MFAVLLISSMVPLLNYVLPDRGHEVAEFAFILLSRRALHAGDYIDAPRLKEVESLGDIPGVQAACDDQRHPLANTGGCRLRALPIEGSACPPAALRGARVK